MSNTDPTQAPQLTDVRREYVDGDLTQGELEAGVERALADGPPIGHDHTPTPPTGLDAITAGVAGLFIAPFVWFVDWQLSEGETITYDWGTHSIQALDEDPGPDDHPAESAGGLKAMIGFFGMYVALGLTTLALLGGLPGLAAVFAAASTLAALAPLPTVEAVERGLGRHTATGSHVDGDNS